MHDPVHALGVGRAQTQNLTFILYSALQTLSDMPDVILDRVMLLELARMFNNREVICFLQTGSEMSIKAKVAEDQSTFASITDHRKVCWSCHAPDEEGRQLSRCRGCRRARYCDQECQAADWDRHSGYCLQKQEKKKKIK